MSFRIDRIWAFLSVGADNEEGVVGFLDRRTGQWMPMVAADEKRLRALQELAQYTAETSGRAVRLVRFDVRTDVEILEPRKGGN